ncbi:MAG: FAD synthetase family protein [Clostridiales bacterium]|nr:FAD synthetase family protein [Clostridiales bacterium]
MRIITDLEFKTDTPTAVALGTFDGVHLGHRAVISAAVENAKANGLVSAVFTFSGLPKNAFLPEGKRICPLCSFEEKARLIEALGVDLLISPEFTRELASMPPEDFVKDILFGRLGARHIVCGFDHRFGFRGLGSTELLLKLCRGAGVGVTVIPPVMDNGERVSSTSIRALLENGRVSDARRLLGHDI